MKYAVGVLVLLTALGVAAADRPKPKRKPFPNPCQKRHWLTHRFPKKVRLDGKLVPREWVCDDTPPKGREDNSGGKK